MKMNKTGLVFLILHTIFIAVFSYFIFTGADASSVEAGEKGMFILPLGMFFDQLPFFILLFVSMVPHLEKISGNTFCFIGTFLVLGGIQWYVIGWFVRSAFRKEFWIAKK